MLPTILLLLIPSPPLWRVYVSGPGNISVSLLSMQGQKALRFHKKYLNLCSEDEQRFYGFGTTWEWVLRDRIKIFGWTIPLKGQIGLCMIWYKLTANSFPFFPSTRSSYGTLQARSDSERVWCSTTTVMSTLWCLSTMSPMPLVSEVFRRGSRSADSMPWVKRCLESWSATNATCAMPLR